MTTEQITESGVTQHAQDLRMAIHVEVHSQLFVRRFVGTVKLKVQKYVMMGITQITEVAIRNVADL